MLSQLLKAQKIHLQLLLTSDYGLLNSNAKEHEEMDVSRSLFGFSQLIYVQ